MKRNLKGCRLLSTVLSCDSWDEIAKRGIRVTDFTDDAQIVYQWVAKYREKYAALPPLELVEEETQVILPKPIDLEAAFDGFMERIIAGEIEARIKAINKEFSNGNFRAAASYFTPITVDREPPKTFLSRRQERFDDYHKRKLLGLSGIDIPWPTLANILIKWEDSTLNVFLAPSSAGKTWVSCYVASEALKAGKRILFVSLENSLDSIGRRLDSLIYKIPFEDMRQSRADLRYVRDWENRLHLNEFAGDIILLDRTQAQTVSDIAAVNQAESPDFVIVDGAYLLKGKGESNWAKAADVLQELQLSCKMGRAPWLCSSQLNPPKNKAASGYDMGFDARYAKEYMLNPDTSFILLQDEDDRVFNRAKIRVSKIREAGDLSGLDTEFEIHANRTTMDFSEIRGDVEYDIDY